MLAPLCRLNCFNNLITPIMLLHIKKLLIKLTFKPLYSFHWYTSYNWNIFFSIWFFFMDTDDSQDSRVRGRKRTIFYSTLPLPLADEISDIYLQLCVWDDYHMFLIAPLVFTRLLLHEIYHLIKLPFDWLMMWR